MSDEIKKDCNITYIKGKRWNAPDKECYYCICRVCSRSYCPYQDKENRCNNCYKEGKKRLLDCDYYWYKKRPHYKVIRRYSKSSDSMDMRHVLNAIYYKLFGEHAPFKRTQYNCSYCTCMKCQYKNEWCHRLMCRNCHNPATDFVRLCVLQYDRKFYSDKK